MLISEFDIFVKESDVSKSRSPDEQLEIAIYGLAAEVGSIVAAVKKRLLAEETHAFNQPNDEIIEELGDAIWYCFALARIANPSKPVNIFAHSIEAVRSELSDNGTRAIYIKSVLDSTKTAEFIRAADEFPKRTKNVQFEDYQKIAFLTARTKSRTLVEVCLAVLWQLGAELLRRNLPEDEKLLNTTMKDRPINDILGEIAWHIAALASVYNLQLGDLAQYNMDKIRQRLPGLWTPLHDNCRPESEKFPREFEVAFVTVVGGRVRMYIDGVQVGDDLTNNSYNEDGYRFHDIMHLANIAKLGWSPVFRKLMRKKRKSDSQLDEVEDGARAGIVEEAVIKAIHREGQRIAALTYGPPSPGPQHLFPSRKEITFTFLKFIQTFVSDLEVGLNRYWEWEQVILEGYEIFYNLQCETQGTVKVNLAERSLSFSPHVHIEMDGRVVGLGTSVTKVFRSVPKKLPPQIRENEANNIEKSNSGYSRFISQKTAILAAIGVTNPSIEDFQSIEITDLGADKLSVKGLKHIAPLIWEKSIVTFRARVTASDGKIYSTALALSD